jgi:tRNA nucleotidyltransferase (CCA-adding enzyme)
MEVGSNTTFLGLKVMEQGIEISETDATIALAGIYADTGNFTHENVTTEDFEVATYLMHHGASVQLVKTFLKTLKEEHQITLFHELLNRLYYADFNGHFIAMSYMEMDQQAGGLAAVVEKVFDVENTDALFSVFAFKKEKSVIIIARSQKSRINLNDVLNAFSGGGHAKAASALLKNREGKEVFQELEKHLRTVLLPAATVLSIMSTDLHVLQEEWTLREASVFLETINHTGAPVINGDGKLTGFMTLRDIMKGRKVDQMHSPVKAYMSKKVITGKTDLTIREVERLLYENHIGHLPIIEDDNTLVGIITRTDYLKHMDKKISLK